MQAIQVIKTQARYQPDVHAWLSKRAKRNNRSMNGELMEILKNVRAQEEQKVEVKPVS